MFPIFDLYPWLGHAGVTPESAPCARGNQSSLDRMIQWGTRIG